MADLNIAGHKISPVAATAIAGGSGLAIWFAWKQHKDSQASSSSSSSSNPDAIDPVTGLPYSEDSTIDPLTGESYLAEAQEYGSVAAAEQAISAESSSDLGEEYSAGSGDTGVDTGTTTTDVGSTGYTSNAQWAQAVQAGLTDLGYSATDVASAIAAYLASLPETSAQAGIVNTALAEYGPPPVGSFTVILASTTTTTGAGGTTGTGTNSGTPAPPASGSTGSGSKTGGPITVVPQDFHVASVSGLTINLAWTNPAIPSGQGPVRSVIVAYGQSASSLPYQQTVPAGATSTSIEFNAGAGSNGLTHYFEAWYDPASTGGPHAGPISAKTQ